MRDLPASRDDITVCFYAKRAFPRAEMAFRFTYIIVMRVSEGLGFRVLVEEDRVLGGCERPPSDQR